MIVEDAGRAGTNARRLRSNLARNAEAMAYLGSVGIDASVCASLELGIKEPYVRADGTRVDGVLVYPIDVADGRRRYGCLNLPGVTISPENPVAWSPGAPRAVLRGERGALIVTCSPLDVFRIWASAERRDLAVAATASSRSGAFPVDWNDTTFWGRWSRVIVAQELPAEMRARIARIARRPIQTTMTNGPKRYGSGMDASDDSNRWLDDMLDASLPTEDRAVANPNAGEAGDFAAEPMPVHGGFCNGRLFYPFRVERRRAMDGGGRALASVARTPAPVTRFLTTARIPRDRAFAGAYRLLADCPQPRSERLCRNSNCAMGRVASRGIACAQNSGIRLILLSKIILFSVDV